MLDDTDLVLKQGDVGEDGDEAEINVNLFDGTRRENGVHSVQGQFCTGIGFDGKFPDLLGWGVEQLQQQLVDP